MLRTLNQRVKQGSQRRRDATRASVENTILQAAGELLLEVGYEAFSLRKVAERIGYSATAIYRHFADKDALLYAVTEEGFRRFTASLRAAGSGEGDPFEWLQAMGFSYIDFGLEHPAYYRVMFMQRPDLLWRRRPDRPGSRMESFGALRAAVEAGEVGRDDRVVLLVTGDGLKTLAPVAFTYAPIRIEADADAFLDAVEAAA